jgi:hypothetical protein
MAEAGIDVELVAASLRASSKDLKTFVEALAVKLDEALPDRVQVERRGTRLLAKERRVERIECQLRDVRYSLERSHGWGSHVIEFFAVGGPRSCPRRETTSYPHRHRSPASTTDHGSARQSFAA